MRYAAIVAGLMASALAVTATAAQFEGTFSSDEMRGQLHAAKGGYAGTIRFRGQEFPCQAQVTPDGTLEGTFSTAGGHDFPFSATVDGETLTLTSGQSSYTLGRLPANPLDAPAQPEPAERPGPEAPKSKGRTIHLDLQAMKKQFRTAGEAYNRKDYATALKSFLPIANNGHVEAQYLLGLMYQHGRGTEQDFEQAAQGYQRAATANHTSALLNLGMLYQAGKGVAQDATKARNLYEKGALLGNAGAQRALGAMCFNGTCGPQNAIDGMAWMQLAAQGGDQVAKQNVAKIRNQNIVSPAQLQAMFKGATITGTDTAGEAGTILLVKLPARGGDEEAIELHKDKDGWKVLDF